jgi:SagB-type dehydrogenase family enzyme
VGGEWPESSRGKKTTASSALNAHDIDIFVFMKDGVYLYDLFNHELDPVFSGDFRAQMQPPRPPDVSGNAPPSSNPPIQLVLVSDPERFRMGSPELRYEWGAIDAGIISQNISLFCAATGLKTCPRASIDKGKIKNLLKLKDSQSVLLNHPVGHSK